MARTGTPIKAAPASSRPAEGGREKTRRPLSPLRNRTKTPSKPKGDREGAPSPPPAGSVDGTAPNGGEDVKSRVSVTVAVRIKPTDGAKTLMRFGPRQENALQFSHMEDGKSDEARNFAFDHLFDQADSQSDVYKAIGGKVVRQVASGCNASVFAYGQTGSGKTYTMLGTPEQRGLIPRLCEGLFEEESLQTWNVTLSFFEIYNEQVVDLLNPPDEAIATEDSKESKEWLGVGLDPRRKVPVINALRVREHAKLGVYVEGLTKLPVKTRGDVEQALEQGTHLRAVAETAMNAESSRSHAVVQLYFAETDSGDKTAVLNLVDLAGSENVGRSRSHEDYSRLQEAKSINKSLLGLGKCISLLAQGGQGGSAIIPYRDSVLTWLLKDALGGNAHTLMLCAVDPSPENGEQTLTTLRYADQAKKIITRPVENIDTTKKVLRELNEQVGALREEAQAAADAQAAARAQAAGAEAAAAEASRAAAEAAAERAAAVAAAEAAKESEQQGRAEAERWKKAAARREAELREKEEALKLQAAQAAEAVRAVEAKSEAKVAAAKADAMASRKGAAAAGYVPAAMAPASGMAPPSGIPATMDVAAVAAMSREEKRAFVKKLKEERKALYVELGIEEDAKAASAAAIVAEETVKGGNVRVGSAASNATLVGTAVGDPGMTPPTSEPPPAFSFAFKCLGFLVTLSVASEAVPESEPPTLRSSGDSPPPLSRSDPRAA